ncbi:substrate-binding domain-containing protein [Nonomuraea sp. NPDC055795]
MAAVGALNALRQAGIDVPGEISVAGINDLRVARFVGLTTVSLPLYEMGAMAAQHVIDAQPGEAATTLLSHRVIPRETTARRPTG